MRHPADMRLQPSDEFALTEPFPGDPDVIETFNIWLYDGDRNIGLNVHPRATGGNMHSSITVFLPDGRIARLNYDEYFPFTDATRPSSRWLKLHCVEPFKTWTAEVENAPVYLSSDEIQASGRRIDETPSATISFSATIENVAPAWINGALLPESRQTLRDQVSWWFGNRLTSGFDPAAFRYDQLVKGEGEIAFEGNTYAFSGVGLRGHVRGVRRMPNMLGHTWAEGYCPQAKRGFGSTMFLRQGGGYEHSEAFLFENGKVYPARILCQPHMVRDAAANDYVFELACDALGLVRITGHDLRAWWWQMPSWGQHGEVRYGFDPAAATLMKQGISRFTWDSGDVGYGLVERSG